MSKHLDDRDAMKFMVWVEGMGAPNIRFNTTEMAMMEAERLCRKENKRVFVLCDMARVSPLPNPVKVEMMYGRTKEKKK